MYPSNPNRGVSRKARSLLGGLLLTVVITTILPPTTRADVSGVRIRYQGVDLQFLLSVDELAPEMTDLLFRSGAVVRRLSEIIASQPDNTLARERDLTIEVSPTGDRFEAYFLSGSMPEIETRYPSGGITVTSGTELMAAICSLLELIGCDDPSFLGQRGYLLEGDSLADAIADPRRDVVITLGSLPSDDPDQQVVIPDVGSQSSGEQPLQARPLGQSMPLGEALRTRAEEVFSDQGSQIEAPLEVEPALAVASAPSYLAVHCTAFGASDAAMRNWVDRRKSEKTRSKSHGVILPSGEWLPIWPFDERRVWATKTETCTETKPKALGTVVNVELHYFCASNRNDETSDNQYRRLADLYVQLKDMFQPLFVVSHREIDRGLRDGHNDPIGFSFDRFYNELTTRGVDVTTLEKISDQRHNLRTGGDISHHWPPMLAGTLILEAMRSDDCGRDH